LQKTKYHFRYIFSEISSEINNQIVARPFQAALEVNNDPLVRKLMSDLELNHRTILKLEKQLMFVQNELDHANVLLENKNKTIKLLRQTNTRIADAFIDELEDWNCEMESLELSLQENLNEIKPYENYNVDGKKNLRKAIIQQNLSGEIEYTLVWLKQITSECDMDYEYFRLCNMILVHLMLTITSDHDVITVAAQKKRDGIERKVVTSWISSILATNEKGNFLAKALDSTNVTTDRDVNTRQICLEFNEYRTISCTK